MNAVRFFSRQWHRRPLLRKAYLGGVCGSSAAVYYDMYQRSYQWMTEECKPNTTGQTVVYASISAMFACVPMVIATPACMLWPITLPFSYLITHPFPTRVVTDTALPVADAPAHQP